MAFSPKRIILHDYGGSPENKDGMFNPYHTLVFPDGTVRYRNPNDPYGEAAPHAFGQNQEAIGLSYAGPVGSKPTPEAMKALQQEYERIQGRYGDLEALGHGEAFEMWKRGHPFAQPSRDGREWQEAAWRGNVADMSRVPEAGLQPLSLLSDPAPAVAAYNPAPPLQRPAEPVRVAAAPIPDWDTKTQPADAPATPRSLQDMLGDVFRQPEKAEQGPERLAMQFEDMQPMQLRMPQARRVDLSRLKAALQSRRA